MPLVATVLIDEPALDREFTYLVPENLAELVERSGIGTIVRVKLQGRRTRGWIMRLQSTQEYEAENASAVAGAAGAIPPTGDTTSASGAPTRFFGLAELEPLQGVVGAGPPQHVVDLTKWAADRWGGTRVHFMRAASPEQVVSKFPERPDWNRKAGRADRAPKVNNAPNANSARVPKPQAPANAGSLDGYLSDNFTANAPNVMQIGPCDDWLPLVEQACELGQVLVLTPTLRMANQLADQLIRRQISVALALKEWEKAARSQVVVGARGAAWAPVGPLDAVIVFDEHDQAYQSEAAPTWHARTVALQRALVDNAECFLVSPAPSPDAIQLTGSGSPIPKPQRPPSLSGTRWPDVEIVNRRGDDPMTGEWCSDRLARVITDALAPSNPELNPELNSGSSPEPNPVTSPTAKTVVCVLNRKGRARLAICRECGEVARNEITGTALKVGDDQLVDPQTGEARPIVCASCGALKFRRARLGVKGVAAQLEALIRRPVMQITSDEQPPTGEPGLFIGTEAVLRRVPSADVVAFLDFDQELTAPRYRAEEEAMALLVLAARMVGSHMAGSSQGQVLVQTRLPDHPVLSAVTNGNLWEWSANLLEARAKLRQPPCVSWALISGAVADEYVSRIRDFASANALAELEIAATSEGVWRLRSSSADQLHAVLSGVTRPKGRLRVEVDPVRA